MSTKSVNGRISNRSMSSLSMETRGKVSKLMGHGAPYKRMAEKRLCEVCQKPIPRERLEALPDTTFCVKHSDVKPVIGFVEYSSESVPDLVVVNPVDKDALWRAQRAMGKKPPKGVAKDEP